MTLVIITDERWRVVVALSPELNLVITVFLGGLLFAEALQGSVVSLVDLPGFNGFGVVTKTHFLEDK